MKSYNTPKADIEQFIKTFSTNKDNLGDITGIEIWFDNMAHVVIPGKHIAYFQIDGITQNIGYCVAASNSIVKNNCFDYLELVISNKMANMEYTGFDVEEGKEMTVFDRIEAYKDIIGIAIITVDCTRHAFMAKYSNSEICPFCGTLNNNNQSITYDTDTGSLIIRIKANNIDETEEETAVYREQEELFDTCNTNDCGKYFEPAETHDSNDLYDIDDIESTFRDEETNHDDFCKAFDPYREKPQEDEEDPFKFNEPSESEDLEDLDLIFDAIDKIDSKNDSGTNLKQEQDDLFDFENLDDSELDIENACKEKTDEDCKECGFYEFCKCESKNQENKTVEHDLEDEANKFNGSTPDIYDALKTSIESIRILLECIAAKQVS